MIDIRRSAATVLLAVAALALLGPAQPAQPSGGTPPAANDQVVALTPTGWESGGPIPMPAAATGSPAPDRVRIPALGVDSPLETLRLDAAGALTPPVDFAKAGWYADGTAPGDLGPAVIAGHVDSRTGPAVFFDLREMSSGDEVEVRSGGEWLTFRVTDVERYPKDEFPTARVYGPTPDAQLRLITCGGVFDAARRSYRDNVVVFATRAD